jgi:signal recognition particle subunit SEC65
VQKNRPKKRGERVPRKKAIMKIKSNEDLKRYLEKLSREFAVAGDHDERRSVRIPR